MLDLGVEYIFHTSVLDKDDKSISFLGKFVQFSYNFFEFTPANCDYNIFLKADDVFLIEPAIELKTAKRGNNVREFKPRSKS